MQVKNSARELAALIFAFIFDKGCDKGLDKGRDKASDKVFRWPGFWDRPYLLLSTLDFRTSTFAVHKT
jgi:hypothetical protein